MQVADRRPPTPSSAAALQDAVLAHLQARMQHGAAVEATLLAQGALQVCCAAPPRGHRRTCMAKCLCAALPRPGHRLACIAKCLCAAPPPRGHRLACVA
jgi:hypothetical protein